MFQLNSKCKHSFLSGIFKLLSKLIKCHLKIYCKTVSYRALGWNLPWWSPWERDHNGLPRRPLQEHYETSVKLGMDKTLGKMENVVCFMHECHTKFVRLERCELYYFLETRSRRMMLLANQNVMRKSACLSCAYCRCYIQNYRFM